MRKFFHELDTDKSGMIGPSEIEETLISLGLARTMEDVQTIVDDLDKDGNGELDFEEFLQMLKDSSMRNCKENYLTDRNLFFEK
jgi:Ca2+-binding EF-hand superfamily protein